MLDGGDCRDSEEDEDTSEASHFECGDDDTMVLFVFTTFKF